jgi:hypothetical protein
MGDVGDGDAVFVGRYHCLERLSIGPIGERWRAKLYGLGGFEKEVSIVRVHPALSDDLTLRARLIRAVSHAAQVPIDGLVRVHDVGVDGDRLHLVAEAIRGLPLDEMRERLYARGRRIPLELVLRILRDLAWTMAQAHARTEVGPLGLCHLAITESLIVIDPEGRPRLLDGGLIPALVRPGWLAAPPPGIDLRALAPEVAAGAWFDARSDVFSIGRLGQRLCAPVRPSPIGRRGAFDWADGDDEDTVERAAAALGRIVDRACADDPEARHPSMGALLADLDGLFEAARPRVVLEGVVPDEEEMVREGGAAALVARREGPRITLTVMGESTARTALGALVMAAARAESSLDERASEVLGPDLPELDEVEALEEVCDDGAGGADGDRAVDEAHLPSAEPLESQITNRVPLPEQHSLMVSLPATLPPPPTLPLTALRDPVRARLGGLARALGVIALLGLVSGSLVAALVMLWRVRGGAEAARPSGAAADRGALHRRAPSATEHEGAPAPPESPVPPLPPPPPTPPTATTPTVTTPSVRVQIATDPPGALVIIDGVARGRTPTALGLAPGAHRMALLLDGYELAREPLGIDAARTVVRVLSPVRMPSALVGRGGLKVRCKLTAGLPLRIFVDDVDTGRDCPNDQRIPLVPGRHHVGLYLPDRDELIAVKKIADIPSSGRTARLYLTY